MSTRPRDLPPCCQRTRKLTYARAYARGRAKAWPHEILSEIPEPRVAVLAADAKRLSDAVDAMLAHFDDRDEDPMQVRIDEARGAVLASLETLHIDDEQAQAAKEEP